MEIINLTIDNFDKEVILTDDLVLIDFFATWCGPCQMMHPVIDEIAKEREDIKVCKVDIDESPELAKKYNVMSVPTIILIKENREIKRIVGAAGKDTIIES